MGERAVPRGVPGEHRRRRVRDRNRRGPLRRRVPHRPRAQPVSFGVRASVRRTVRTRLPARVGRCAGLHPGPQAIRHGTLRRRELLREHHVARRARRGAGRVRPERRGDRRRSGRARRRVRPASRGSPGDRLRGPGPPRRHDGARHSRVPAPPRAHQPRDRRDHRARHPCRDERTRRRYALDLESPRTARRAVPRRRHRARAQSRPARSRPRRCLARRRVPPERESGLRRRARRAAWWSWAAGTSPSTPHEPRCAPRRPAPTRPRPFRWPRPRRTTPGAR